MAPPPLPPPPPPISFSKNSTRREERDRTTVSITTRARDDESSNDHNVNEESRPRSTTTTNSSTSNGVSTMSLPPLPPRSSLVTRNSLPQTQTQLLPLESDTSTKMEGNTTVIMSSNDVTSSGPIISETMVTSMASQHNSSVKNEKTPLQDAGVTRSAMDTNNNSNEDDLMPNAVTVAPPIMMPFDNVIPQCLESVEELRSYIMRNPLEHEGMEQLMQQNGARSEGEAKLFVLQTIQKRMDEIFHSCWTLIHPSYYTIGGGGGDNSNNDNESTKEDVEVRLAMSNQIMSKAKQTVLLCSMYVTGYDGTCTSLPNAQASLLPSHDDIIDDGRNHGPPYPIQAAVARLMECALAVIRFHLPSGGQSTTIQQPPNYVVEDDQQVTMIIQCYVHYQTQTLNERCKPAVANLVSLRNVVMKQQQTAQTFGELLIQYAMEESSNHPEDADDDDHDDNAAQQRRQQKVQPHMFAITTIINEATSLIHPLTCWYDALSPPSEHNGGQQPHETEGLEVLCLRSIHELDHIVSSLVEKLGKWFLIDREIATTWMEHYGIRSNKKRGGVLNQQETTFYKLQQHQQEEILDSIILEELAYLCQLLSRYSKFIEPYLEIAKDTLINDNLANHATGGESTTTSSAIVDNTHPLQLMVQELIGYYSTLEDSLFSRKLSRAMDIATVPAEIYDGIYVSTLVEDAYYLSKRTLERVVSTGNDQAIITLTNRICESWGASGASSHHSTNNGLGGGNEQNDNDNDILGMYRAIECGIGCDFSALIKQQEELKRQKELSKQRTSNAPSSGSDAFASAFLEALDDDIMTSAGESTSSTNGTSKHSSTPSRKRVVRTTPPTSGNLLSLASFVSTTTTTTIEQDVLWQLKSHLCVLNSIASASSACSAIAALYSDVIEGRLLHDNDEDDDVVLHNNNNNDNDVQFNKHQDPTTNMLEFTRDEWKTHSRAYKSMLDQKVNEELDHWVGIALVPSHPDLIPPSSSSATSTKPISSSGIHWLKGVGVGLGGSSTSSTMDSTTSTTQDENKEATMRARHPKPLVQIQMTFCYQNYHISSELYHKYESTLVSKLIHPLRRCLLIQHIDACESHVKLEIIGTLAKRITNHIILPMILEGIGHGPTAQLKQFTDWGALLLSKQVRLLQTELCTYLNNDKPSGVERPSDEGAAPTAAAAADSSIPMMNTAPILQAFEKVFQAITILQLEKPSDWLVMRYSSSVGGSDDGSEGQQSNLTIHEIKHIMLLRVGFSPEAVAKVCQSLLSK